MGGFRPEPGAAQEYGLALRIAADGGRVAHVPDVLYHRARPLAAVDGEAARAVLRSHLERVGREGVVESGPAPGLHRVRFGIRGAPLVSIVIASACLPVRIRGERTFYLRKCLESIGRGNWRKYEIIVLHGPAVPAELGRMLDQYGAVRAAYATPFNWARAMNQGAALARGEHLLFLNDDVEVITPAWLERLLEFSQQPEIGAVGATLFFPGGQIQHAGVAILGGRPLHPFYAHRGDHPGYFNSLLAPRNCSAVTGACLMTRADVFRSVGGFDEGFPLNYNDVDYCLRLIAGGRRVVCTPHARLYHHELGTRRAPACGRRRWTPSAAAGARPGRWTRSTTPTSPSSTWTAASERPQAHRSDPRMKSICFVAGGESLPGGPIRIGERLAALASAARGRSVHFLWCGPAADAGFRHDKRRLEAAGVGVHRLDEIPVPAACRAANGTPGCGPALYASNLIRHAVEALHRARRFDAVVFPAWQAPGFRCVQAKRAGAAFADVNLIVRLDCVSRRLREADKRWPEPDDLFLDYCERYTFDNADVRWCPSESMLREITRLGWAPLPELRGDAGGDGLDALFRPPPPAAADAAPASPVATVAVTHYNLGRYLPETLASLAAQTCSDLEVIVLDDGSTCEQSRRVWDAQSRLYPQFRFVRQDNVGLGAARNRALREATAPCFIPVDADNVATPGMVESFVRAMRADPGAAAMTCFFLAFRDSCDVARGQFLYQCCPTGGPHVAACACNVYGDANAVFRTADLRAVGGFPEDRSTYCHDWETFVKLARSGRRVGVVPDYLFYYRRRADGMSAVMTRGGTDVYPFVRRMLTTFFGVDDADDLAPLWATFAASLLRPREPPPEPWTLRRLWRGTVRRLAGLFRHGAPKRVAHFASDPLAHRLVEQGAVVAAGHDLDDGVAAELLQRRL